MFLRIYVLVTYNLHNYKINRYSLYDITHRPNLNRIRVLRTINNATEINFKTSLFIVLFTSRHNSFILYALNSFYVRRTSFWISWNLCNLICLVSVFLDLNHFLATIIFWLTLFIFFYYNILPYSVIVQSNWLFSFLFFFTCLVHILYEIGIYSISGQLVFL